jgi:SET domain-containing protein
MHQHTHELGNAWFIVRDSGIQGKGAFARKRIPSGTRIIEYTGEIITHEEADNRYDDAAMERHHTFLFAVDEETVIDGASEENPAKYINHSCEPNCEPVVEGKRVFIDAIRDIAPGEELFYDYAYERDPDGDDDETLYVCLCGSPKCRGSILAPKE